MGDEEILMFLRAIDDELANVAAEGESLDLYLLGRSALVLGFGVRLMTKDVDVVYTHGSKLLDRAVEIFGAGTPAAAEHGFYLEAVSSGLPPLPIGYQKRCIAIPGPWRVLRPGRPEIHDLAATKLSRFHVRDREDIQILSDTGELTVDGLRSAVDLDPGAARPEPPPRVIDDRREDRPEHQRAGRRGRNENMGIDGLDLFVRMTRPDLDGSSVFSEDTGFPVPTMITCRGIGPLNRSGGMEGATVPPSRGPHSPEPSTPGGPRCSTAPVRPTASVWES
jgi:hypothetical protein